MHFADLDLCKYAGEWTNAISWRVPLRAIGWLEHAYPYVQGRVPVVVRTRLRILVQGTSTAPIYLTMTGAGP